MGLNYIQLKINANNDIFYLSFVLLIIIKEIIVPFANRAQRALIRMKEEEEE